MSDMTGVDSHSAFQPLRYSYLAYSDRCLSSTGITFGKSQDDFRASETTMGN
jgi:hypothetical protein